MTPETPSVPIGNSDADDIPNGPGWVEIFIGGKRQLDLLSISDLGQGQGCQAIRPRPNLESPAWQEACGNSTAAKQHHGVAAETDDVSACRGV